MKVQNHRSDPLLQMAYKFPKELCLRLNLTNSNNFHEYVRYPYTLSNLLSRNLYDSPFVQPSE